ncbi:MAG: nucleotidyltransferase domain-containing protein [Nanoarchaeota archaeon]
MKQELIKPIIKVGNSAGVLLPKEWINGRAQVKLIERPPDIKKDVLEILDRYLEDILGIYIVGSYARSEETKRSDIDILAITENESMNIIKNKYNIILIPKIAVERTLNSNILPLLPMLKEAKPIINRKLIEDYKKTLLNKKNLRFYIETGKSALKMNKASINLDKQWPSNCGDAVAYSLTLRLRSSYIIDSIIKGRKWSNDEFIKIIKRVSGSLRAYEGYLRIKDNRPQKEELPIKEAEKLHDHILKKINEHEKWVKRKS